MNLLTTILAFAFALGSLIVVHEFGHYLVARLCNVKVLRFSVGFGRVLASRRYGRDQTEWAISAFPLGGYVKMLDEREGEVAPQDLPRAFNRQSGLPPLRDRAGRAGREFPARDLSLLVDFHARHAGDQAGDRRRNAPGSPAAAAQFVPGETIIKIGPQAVTTWQDARWALLKHAVEKSVVMLEVQNDRNEIAWRKLDLSQLSTADLDGDFLRTLGFERLQPPLPPVIGRVLPGGAAERGGLAGGRRDSHDQRRVDDALGPGCCNRQQQSRQGTGFVVQRDAAVMVRIAVTPDAVLENGERIGRIGAAPRIDRAAMQKYMVEVRYSPWTSLVKALERTWDTSAFSLRMLGKMVVGEVSLKNLSGPITIADYAGQSAQIGWISYLVFLALISISLGVLNLLPIPLLDGGHLMYYMLEIVKGSPVSDKAMEIGQHVGMGMLLLLMAFALYNDITRLING